MRSRATGDRIVVTKLPLLKVAFFKVRAYIRNQHRHSIFGKVTEPGFLQQAVFGITRTVAYCHLLNCGRVTMAQRAGRHKDRLSESWATMEEDQGAQSVELTDDDEFAIPQPRPLPKVTLRSSRMDDLNEALGASASSSRRGAQSHRPDANDHRSSQAETTNNTPKKRMPRGKEAAGFVMPTLDHSSSHETSPVKSPVRPSGRGRSSGTMNTPNKRGTRLPRSKPDYDESLPQLLWLNLLAPVLTYSLQVLGVVARVAKPLIGYALAIYLVVGALIMARNLLFTSLASALTPLCRIPGSSSLVPFCEVVNNFSQPHGDVEFDKLVNTQAAFEELITTSAEGASLPMDMKRSEASIRDLRHVVEYSHLPSRNELVFEFTGFIDTARQASSDLSKYNSRIGRAVDRILSTNRWTLQVLEGVEASRLEQGSVSRFIGHHLNIFAPFQAPDRVTRDILFDQYIRHTSAVEEQIQGLILEAQALLAVLQNLDDRLDLIASIATRDDNRVHDNKDELFAQLWTILGGNRASVSRVQKQLSVLREVGAYRRLAIAHVSTTVVKLQGIAAALEDLRERVARPEVLGVGASGGIKRDEIPLEMHIGEIVMGLERLEAVREEGRQIEGQRIRGILDRDEKMGIGSGP